MSEKKKVMLADHVVAMEKTLLAVIKEYNFLLALSSFAIVIARFSDTLSDAAKQHSIIASVFFLIAFLCQIWMKAIDDPEDPTSQFLPAGLSFCSILVGLISFFLIIFEYSLLFIGIVKLFSVSSVFVICIIVCSIGFYWTDYLFISILYYFNKKKRTEKMDYKAFFFFCIGFSTFSYSLLFMIISIAEIFHILGLYTDNKIINRIYYDVQPFMGFMLPLISIVVISFLAIALSNRLIGENIKQSKKTFRSYLGLTDSSNSEKKYYRDLGVV